MVPRMRFKPVEITSVHFTVQRNLRLGSEMSYSLSKTYSSTQRESLFLEKQIICLNRQIGCTKENEKN